MCVCVCQSIQSSVSQADLRSQLLPLLWLWWPRWQLRRHDADLRPQLQRRGAGKALPSFLPSYSTSFLYSSLPFLLPSLPFLFFFCPIFLTSSHPRFHLSSSVYPSLLDVFLPSWCFGFITTFRTLFPSLNFFLKLFFLSPPSVSTVPFQSYA